MTEDQPKKKRRMNMTVLDFFDAHGVIVGDEEWAISTGKETMAELWEIENMNPKWRVWIATRTGILSNKDNRLFACWCVRQIWHLLKDDRSKHAVEVAEKFAMGDATIEELREAEAAAREAWAATRAAGAATRAAAWEEEAATWEATGEITGEEASGEEAWEAAWAAEAAAGKAWAAEAAAGAATWAAATGETAGKAAWEAAWAAEESRAAALAAEATTGEEAWEAAARMINRGNPFEGV